MSVGRPLTPEEAGAYSVEVIPPAVFDAINEMIAEKITRGSVTLRCSDVYSRLREKGIVPATVSMVTVFDSYGRNGWKVYHDIPGYDETYEAYWRLTANNQ